MRSRIEPLTLALLLAAYTTTTVVDIERVCAYAEAPARACTEACAEALRATDCTDDRVRELERTSKVA